MLFSVLGLWGTASGTQPRTLHSIVAGRIKPPTLPVVRNGQVMGHKRLPFVSSGLLKAAAEADAAGVSAADDRLEEADGENVASPQQNVRIDAGTLGCRQRNTDGAVRVNQDCTFRRQAEEEITANPADQRNLLAGQNDSRVGYNQCGIDFSTDSGRHWGDLLPPFRQKQNDPASEFGPVPGDPNSHSIMGGEGTDHTYDAASDPAVAFDSRGRGYFSCVLFDVASNASALFVTASPAGAQGAYFYNISPADRRFMVVEDNSPLVFHDKNFITADTNRRSPNRDNVYVTWTVFRFDPTCAGGTADVPGFCQSPIFGAMSTDGGFHFSTPEQISGRSPLCSFGNALDPSAPVDACNFDQGSDPVTLANGDLLVPFNNGNTPAGNPNAQQLAVRCSPTGDSAAGTAHLNCAPPTKAGDDIVTGEPLCDFGRGPEECIPGPFIRTNDFPRAQTTAADGSTAYITWQDYRNGEFDIQLARTTDGGLTWSPAVQVNPDTGLDHYFSAVDPARDDKVAVSYFRSERVPGENSTPAGGFAPVAGNGVQDSLSDYVLAGGRGLTAPFRFVPVAAPFVAPDGIQTGFNGDYSGLVVVGDTAHPIWSDTRNANPDPVNAVGHDEDIFTVARNVPSGRQSPQHQSHFKR
jgi:hypothetical protein